MLFVRLDMWLSHNEYKVLIVLGEGFKGHTEQTDILSNLSLFFSMVDSLNVCNKSQLANKDDK